MQIRLFLSLVLMAISCLLQAQISINEYSVSNLEGFIDSYDKAEDWVELYNSSTSVVDISGWYLSDKVSKPTKWSFPSGTVIEANGYIIIYCSGRDSNANEEFHTNFKLKQTKGNDHIVLSNINGDVIESIPLQLTLLEHSRAKDKDGEGEFLVCKSPTFGKSNDNVTKYISYTNSPSMDLEAGFYSGKQTINLVNNEPNSRIRYTLDGRNPSLASPEYIFPIEITSTTVVKASSFSSKSNILPGKIEFNTYFIDEDFSVAVFSVAADKVQDLANGEGGLIPIGSLEYFNLEKERVATSFGSLNRHGQDSWALPHRSLDWISRDEMGYSSAVQAPLFSYSERDEYQKFMFRNSGDDNYPAIDDMDHEGSAHVRDEYVQHLSLKGGMKLDLRANERVVLFLNGQYWGLYGMRERPVDHDYTEEYYGQDKYHLQYLSTWGDTEIEYGGDQAKMDWEEIRDFVLENDTNDANNYAKITKNINVLSLIDYMLVNLNVVAQDWLNYNTGWWRGIDPKGDHKKWGYILWDLDATFGYYINYTNIPNTGPDADPCDLEAIGVYMDEFFGDGDTLLINPNPELCNSIINGSSPYPETDSIFQLVVSIDSDCCDDWDGQCGFIYGALEDGNYTIDDFFRPSDVGQHEKIFLKLLAESSVFKKLYYSRYADLMNTVYTCENMLSTLDSMIAVIEPEMPRQIQRWGGTMAEWKANVAKLRKFVTDRCTMIDDGAIECYDELSGPYNITLLTEPNGIGGIDFNTLELQNFPWNGDYFGGMTNTIKAKTFTEYETLYSFSHWESKSGNSISPTITDDLAEYSVVEPDTLIAVFKSLTDVNDLNQSFIARVYPNPTYNHLTLEYTLEEAVNVNVSMYSAMGQKVMSLSNIEGEQPTGHHKVNINLDKTIITAGFYFVVLQAGDITKSFKISVVD